MLPDDLLAEFKIDRTPIWPEEDARLEPIFLDALWFDFDEAENPEPVLEDDETTAPPPAEPVEIAELDHERLEDLPEPPETAQPRASPLGLAGSIAIHLLTFAIFLTWTSAPAELGGGAIPVQLIVEEEAPTAPDDTAPGQLAADIGAAAPQAAKPTPAPPIPRDPAPQPSKAASVAPKPPKPKPPEPKPPEPKPKETLATLTSAPPPPPARASSLPSPAPGMAQSAITPAQNLGNPSASATQPRGTATGKGDYYAYLVTLTKGHFDLLPLSFLAGRRGRTTLQVTVLEDGTIGPIAVKQSSGYPDIDARVGQMVAAVGHFPPLPEGLRRPSVDLDFNLTFPDALQQ